MASLEEAAEAIADSHNHSPRDSHDHSPTPGRPVYQFLNGFDFQSNVVDSFFLSPLSWTDPALWLTPAGEAETSAAGEHLVKE